MEALFSSLGDPLRERVLRVLREAALVGGSHRVELHIMTFSFTDAGIADVLIDLAQTQDVVIRVIADWSQGGDGGGRQVGRLVRLRHPNVCVRFKNDQPYIWDPACGRLRWSYRASRGLLHHKTLCVLVDGAPTALVCGSFNWTETALSSYENLLVIRASDAESINLMCAVEREFEAMWSDGAATLSPDEAHSHYIAILDEYRRDPMKDPATVVGLGRGADAPMRREQAQPAVGADMTGCTSGTTIAFSSRSPFQARAEAGYSPLNRDRRLDLRKPSGRSKRVPLTLSTLALDVIARAQRGDRLLVAMYGMSARVPEYGAQLDAARRGVRLDVLVDGHVGKSVLSQLAIVAVREQLRIRLRGGARMMHQKYIVHPESSTVLTGTANLSTDATSRHSEHRIVVRARPDVAARFLADFRTIFARVPAPFGTAR